MTLPSQTGDDAGLRRCNAWEASVSLRQLKALVGDQQDFCQRVQASHGWHALQMYYRARARLLPKDSRRERWLKGMVRSILRGARAAAAAPLTFTPPRDVIYEAWIAACEPAAEALELQRSAQLGYMPTISIVVPTYNTPATFLRDMLRSVQNQTYPRWELCVADGASTTPWVADILEEASAQDGRICFRRLDHNHGIVGNTNEALAMATGEYVAFMDHDDTLAPFALFAVAQAINTTPEADLIYSDEDKLSTDGSIRFAPHFKPDWAPDSLRSQNYISHLTVLSAAVLDQIGVLNSEYEGSQDYDLVLRASEKARAIVHIPQVLYHWRAHASSTAGVPSNKTYAYVSGQKAIAHHLERIGIAGTVAVGPCEGVYQVRYSVPVQPRVTIVIPNRDQHESLKTCVSSIRKATYKNWEIVIVENGSQQSATFDYYREVATDGSARILEWQFPFNYAAINNFAVKDCGGDVVLFLNNDVEAINDDWLANLVEHAVRADVGAVGAMLSYPDNTIQHAGIMVDPRGVAAHHHQGFPSSALGYMSRLVCIQNTSAVTGACLMVRRNVFAQVGGFNEELAIALNDVDLCYRIRHAGYRVVWTPFARLYHYESKTRGSDKSGANKARFEREQELFRKLWHDVVRQDDQYCNQHLISRPEFH